MPDTNQGIYVMNLNPFVYTYKRYPNSKLATMVNNLCSAMQRLFFFFGFVLFAIILFGVITNKGDITNMIEALICSVIMILIWLIIKFNKNKWSDKISAKQELIDN